jgi:hypothetical protein
MTPDDFILLSDAPVVSLDVDPSQDGAPKLGKAPGMYYLRKLVDGSGGRADLDHALEGSAMAPHANGCYLPVEHSRLIPSIVQRFESEFVEHFSRGCRSCRDVVLPKIVDDEPPTCSFSYLRSSKHQAVDISSTAPSR